MSKKRELDPGLQYLLEIGFDKTHGKNGLQERLEKVFGKKTAIQIYSKRVKIEDGSIEFYEFKNSDPRISRIFSEVYDGDILRKACNYIYDQREFFGNTILEVGCEAGYMTGFLARTFPESKIVSIDRSKAAIDMAKSRANKLGIENVEFRNCSLKEVEEEFDTVFCMRTIQENINYDEAPYAGEPIVKQFYMYKDLTNEYSIQLLSCLKESGSLCVFERVGHNPLMCGWMLNLNHHNCGFMDDTYKEYLCEEVGEHNTFQAFICRKGAPKKEESEIIEYWYSAIEINPAGKNQISGWNALVYLYENAGKLIRGVRIISGSGKTVGRFGVFEDKDDDALLYYLLAVGTDIQLYSYKAELRNDLLKNMLEAIDVNQKAGHHVEEIDITDEWIEGRTED